VAAAAVVVEITWLERLALVALAIPHRQAQVRVMLAVMVNKWIMVAAAVAVLALLAQMPLHCWRVLAALERRHQYPVLLLLMPVAVVVVGIVLLARLAALAVVATVLVGRGEPLFQLALSEPLILAVVVAAGLTMQLLHQVTVALRAVQASS
jgi:hypothetical protein